MTLVLIPMPGNEALASALAQMLDAEIGAVNVRRFPDGESYVRYDTPIEGRRIILVCALDRPDEKFLPLIFAAAAARDIGAGEVGLVAPYLAYMRQDRRFQPGEAVTSTYFSRALDLWIDWLVTVDPHLHRRSSLSEIYSAPAVALHAAPEISAWIRESISNPLLIGPDSESEQWVGAVADGAGAPFIVLEKIRRGDRDVEVSAPNIDQWRDRTPVLIDDIISTARTMIAATAHLREGGMSPPVCVGVHAVFAGNAYRELQIAGAGRIVTCNTIAHESNEINVTALIADGVRRVVREV